MRFAPTLTRRAPLARVEGKATPEARAGSAARYYFGRGVPYKDPWDIDRAVDQGLLRVVWLFRCCEMIASSAASLPIGIRQDDPVTGPWATDHWIVPLLNKQVSPYHTALEFRWRLVMLFLLSKQGVFIEVVRGQSGRPIALYILPPGRTAPIPDPDRYIAGFEVYTNTGERDVLPPYMPGGREPSSVLWLRRPHPTDPYSGLTVIEAAGLTIDTAYFARLFNRNFMVNDGRPGGLVSIKGDLAEDDGGDLQHRFSGGVSKAGRIEVIEAEDITYLDFGTTPRDMQYVDAFRQVRDEICVALGVPLSLLGDSSQRTFSNSGQEEVNYWRGRIARETTPWIDSVFDLLTEEGASDDLYVRHRFDEVPVLVEHAETVRKNRTGEFSAGLITAAQWADVVGLGDSDTYSQPGANVLWIPAGKIPVGGDEETTTAAQALKVVAPAAPGAPSEEPQPGEGEQGQLGGAPEQGQLPPGASPWDMLSAADWQNAGAGGDYGSSSDAA